MSYRTYYDKIQSQLETRWIKESLIANNPTSADMLGNRIGMDPYKFGFVIWDWDERYAERLRQLKYQSYSKLADDDPLKYKKWASGSAGREDFYGIPFQFIERVPIWSKSANYSDYSDIIGRFESQSSYNNSSANDMTLTLTYNALSSKGSGMESESTKNDVISADEWTMGAIKRFVLQLQSLVYPQYDGLYGPPVKVLLNIGSEYIDVPVSIKAVTVEASEPFEITTMTSMMKKVTVEMRSAYPSWQAITATQVWTADTGAVFARQELNPLS